MKKEWIIYEIQFALLTLHRSLHCASVEKGVSSALSTVASCFSLTDNLWARARGGKDKKAEQRPEESESRKA